MQMQSAKLELLLATNIIPEFVLDFIKECKCDFNWSFDSNTSKSQQCYVSRATDTTFLASDVRPLKLELSTRLKTSSAHNNQLDFETCFIFVKFKTYLELIFAYFTLMFCSLYMVGADFPIHRSFWFFFLSGIGIYFLHIDVKLESYRIYHDFDMILDISHLQCFMLSVFLLLLLDKHVFVTSKRLRHSSLTHRSMECDVTEVSATNSENFRTNTSPCFQLQH